MLSINPATFLIPDSLLSQSSTTEFSVGLLITEARQRKQFTQQQQQMQQMQQMQQLQQMQQMQQWQKFQQMQQLQNLQKMQSLVGGPIGRAGVQMVRYQAVPSGGSRMMMRPQGPQMIQGNSTKDVATEHI